jgi:hypothetical protein
MVAMSGAIIPDPFAIPEIVVRTPPISAVAVAPLGKVSVHRLARQPVQHAAELGGVERFADHAG